MMDWTDRHDRFFLRQISAQALLYTEMITTGAVLQGDREKLLRFDSCEHPVAVQLGGSDPEDLAASALICEQAGYDEVNLNVGCPSDRVQSGKFGACLMAEPDLVASCIRAMQDAVKDTAITIKHRIGIDGRESYQQLVDFVGKVADTGCKTFIVHARIAILSGLSPKQNREVPPLKYETVYRLKQNFPDLEIILNGGVTELEECRTHLEKTDGVMLGRAAYHNPFILARVDEMFFGAQTGPTRADIIERLIPYVDQQLAEGVRLHQITRHILGLYQGVPGARAYRRYISENAPLADATSDVIRAASALVEDRWLAHTG